jgi:hypothetical protein
LELLDHLKKPVVFTFHSVIPHPAKEIKNLVTLLASYASIVFAMTRESKNILENVYAIPEQKIVRLPHGTHNTIYEETFEIKKKLGFENHKLLTTFGLLSRGKSIETALNALPNIIAHFPQVLYLVIGKSHPKNILNGIDPYRIFLENKVKEMELDDHVIFIDRYLDLPELLEYLKASDLYLFTSKDPNQAISGTFAYAMSCACPIVATSIPHTREALTPDTGIVVDIEDYESFSNAVVQILSNDELRHSMALSAYRKTRESSWDNVAVKHVNSYVDKIKLFPDVLYRLPPVKLNHIIRLTSQLGIIQFSKINIPDISSGYTLDDNARALIAMSMHYSLFGKKEDLFYINIYLSFIERCQQPAGTFVNYIDKNNHEHIQNSYVNLEDSNARAVWALGTLISMEDQIPETLIKRSVTCFLKCTGWVQNILSPRAIGFSIKGLYAYYTATKEQFIVPIIENLAKNLISKYDLHAVKNWKWFENYMTYANGILPEAMLYAHLTTGNPAYQKVALESFDFLLSKMFENNHFRVISNRGWHQKNTKPQEYGEQPIDVAYTIQTLYAFYKIFKKPEYMIKMNIAFRWFLGKNHLNQFIYNSGSGGCFDGLEETEVNINQGAESTICYLMSRLIMEYNQLEKIEKNDVVTFSKPYVSKLRNKERRIHKLF